MSANGDKVPRTRITFWRELTRHTRTVAARKAGVSKPTWLKFEKLIEDWLTFPRKLFGAVNAGVLVVPPTAANLNLADVELIGSSRYSQILDLVKAALEQRDTSHEQREALARVLFTGALVVVSGSQTRGMPAQVDALEQALQGEAGWAASDGERPDY